jgi:hypothetical protein
MPQKNLCSGAAAASDASIGLRQSDCAPQIERDAVDRYATDRGQK